MKIKRTAYQAKSLKGLARNAQSQFANVIGQDANAKYGFGNAVGNSQDHNTLGDFDRTLVIEIALIDSTAIGVATLFGAALDLTEATNTGNNVTVTIQETSHPKVKANILAGAIRINGGVLNTKTAAQLAKGIVVYKDGIAGDQAKTSYYPLARRTSKDYTATQIDMIDFKQVIDMNTYFTYSLLAGESVSITLFISDIVDTGRVLQGENVRIENHNEMPGVAKERAYSGRY